MLVFKAGKPKTEAFWSVTSGGTGVLGLVVQVAEGSASELLQASDGRLGTTQRGTCGIPIHPYASLTVKLTHGATVGNWRPKKLRYRKWCSGGVALKFDWSWPGEVSGWGGTKCFLFLWTWDLTLDEWTWVDWVDQCIDLLGMTQNGMIQLCQPNFCGQVRSKDTITCPIKTIILIKT